ncbi:MAG: hypothetical protein ACE15C_19205 [Phycisphaerae bacterium]
MAEMYPSDGALNALSGTSDAQQEVLFIAAGESPYYTSFYKMQQRLLEVARRAGDLRVFKDGELTFGVRAGRFMDGAIARAFAGAAAQALADNAVNYIYLTAAGTLVVNSSAFPSPADTPHIPLATVATGTASAAGVAGKYDFADIVDYRGRAIYTVPSALSPALANLAAGFVDPAATRKVLHATTANATATEMTLDGLAPSSGNRYVISDERTCALRIIIAAREEGGGNAALYHRQCIVQRAGGNLALVGDCEVIGTDIESESTWDVQIIADNLNKCLQVLVTGAAGATIRWVAVVEAVEIVDPG